jgi:hypothetical protein
MSDTMSTSATTIDDVIDGLSDVVARATASGDRVGYFAALYRQVTIEVARSITRGEFDDGPRMSRFDAAFGNRYFAALDQWEHEAEPTGCWPTAFGHGTGRRCIIVQHLLLGVNAHINLDLAVAAAEIAPGDSIEALERDFFLINDILVNVLDRVQGALNGVSPLMRLLDVVGGRTDEQILDFSITRARAAAWDNARLLARMSEVERAEKIAALDARTERLARRVTRPYRLLQPAIEVVRLGERHDVATVIARLDTALDHHP